MAGHRRGGPQLVAVSHSPNDDVADLIAPPTGFLEGAMRRCKICNSREASALLDAALERLATGASPEITYWHLHERLRAKFPEADLPEDPRSLRKHLERHRKELWGRVLQARAGR